VPSPLASNLKLDTSHFPLQSRANLLGPARALIGIDRGAGMSDKTRDSCLGECGRIGRVASMHAMNA
jgi:hypothetical protein